MIRDDIHMLQQVGSQSASERTVEHICRASLCSTQQAISMPAPDGHVLHRSILRPVNQLMVSKLTVAGACCSGLLAALQHFQQRRRGIGITEIC